MYCLLFVWILVLLLMCNFALYWLLFDGWFGFNLCLFDLLFELVVIVCLLFTVVCFLVCRCDAVLLTDKMLFCLGRVCYCGVDWL